MAREEFQSLTEQMFYLLLALDQPRYGLEISNYIRELTGGRILLPPGTLYALLARFEQENYIALVKPLTNRKVYRITEQGKALLAEEYQRLCKMIADYQKGEQDND